MKTTVHLTRSSSLSRLVISAIVAITFAVGTGGFSRDAAASGDRDAWSEWTAPFDWLNRQVFDFNRSVSWNVIEPAVRFTEDHVPAPVRNAIYGIVTNLEEPLSAVSNLLAGDFEGADVASRRFLINTFLGYAGAEDVAALHYGFDRRPADLRKVLCRVGLPAGPIVVVPLFGETNLRDLFGRYGTIFMLYQVLGTNYVPYRVSTGIVATIDRGPDAQDTSFDGETFEQMRARMKATADQHC